MEENGNGIIWDTIPEIGWTHWEKQKKKKKKKYHSYYIWPRCRGLNPETPE
jgi:hypothetical protein